MTKKLGLAWSDCFSDDSARALGYNNRNDAAGDNCVKYRDGVYMSARGDVGNWEDCHDNNKFRIRCVSPDWIQNSDWKDDGCSAINERRYSRQVDAHGLDWNASADWIIASIGDTFQGKPIIRKEKVQNNGQYIWIFVKDDSCKPSWANSGNVDGWKDDGCQEAKLRRYARQVDAKNFDWDASADFLMNQLSTFQNKPIDKKEKNRNNGLWVWIYVKDDTCGPNFAGEESTCQDNNKIAFRQCNNWLNNDPNSCKAGMPDNVVGWQACGIGSTPKSGTCSYRTLDKNDIRCALGQSCFAITKNEPNFDCDTERLDTSVNRKDKNLNIKTMQNPRSSLIGEFGLMNSYVNDPITTKTKFSLECEKWISPNTRKKTFLRGDPDAIRTDNDVAITVDNLDNKYLYTFVKNQCQTDDYILYGNRVQLKNVATGNYIQCGAGTCSGVNSSGSCKTGEWQTFTIQSVTGKTGRVSFGDSILIEQTTGTKARITAADGGAVEAHDSNKNSPLKLQGLNGSLYKDPTSEMATYEIQRCPALCAADPTNPKCTFGDCSPLQTMFQKYKIIIIVVVVLLLCCSSCVPILPPLMEAMFTSAVIG